MAVHAAEPVGSSSPPIEASSALQPLGENLVSAWHFDNEAQEWSMFLPDPIFSDANSLTALFPGEVYSIKVNADQSVTLNGIHRTLVAGWNEVPW